MIFVRHPDTILRVAFHLRTHALALAAEQAARLQAVAETAPAWRVVAVFCDIDPEPGRPARTGAAHAAAGGFDVLLVESLERLTCNTDGLHDLIAAFTAARVVVVSLGRRPTSPPHRPGDGPDLLAVTADDGLLVQPITVLAAGQQPLPALLGAPMAEEG